MGSPRPAPLPRPLNLSLSPERDQKKFRETGYHYDNPSAIPHKGCKK